MKTRKFTAHVDCLETRNLLSSYGSILASASVVVIPPQLTLHSSAIVVNNTASSLVSTPSSWYSPAMLSGATTVNQLAITSHGTSTTEAAAVNFNAVQTGSLFSGTVITDSTQISQTVITA